MGGAIKLDAVSLVSIFTECILYGYFSVLAVIALYILLSKRAKHQKLNKPMVAVSIVMFILGTIHAGVDLRRLLVAFLDQSDDTGGAIAYLSEVNTVLYAIKSTAYCMQTLIGDGFVLYRLYLVWNGKKIIVIPIAICFVASIGVGIGALQGFARASPAAPVFINDLQNWIVSFFSLTLFTNFSCTSLIAGRIWWVHRRTMGLVVSGHSLVPAAVVIIESGAIYSVCLIILLSLYLSGSFAQYIVLDAVTQVIGIVFSLIIVRVGLGLSSDQTEGETKKLTTLFSSNPTDSRQHHSAYPMRNIAIKIDSATHNDSMGTDFQDGRFENSALSEQESGSHRKGASEYL
ncbi:hypothetical protein BT96DRAFT_622171 [Gymnopus androsaceus JB14]|uniref:Uncharacterized protein n=1 Tax=Gymnopus androsaceus JB14 TaxID=1447944 RepID=A0A6A4GGU5_9AGAR|nr:hypothetical protein BT96DRAFT_622171 [Gymnopus androsaceus JB14]